MQPAKEAVSGDHQILDIGYRFSGAARKIILEITYTSCVPNKFRDFTTDATVQQGYDDCQAYVDDGIETVNYLILSARQWKEPELYVAVARAAVGFVKDLFPDYDPEETIEACEYSHNLHDALNYGEVCQPHYFGASRKWQDLCCRECKQKFQGNKKPTAARPVYLCHNLCLDQCTITDGYDGAICHACFDVTKGGTTRRRGRK